MSPDLLDISDFSQAAWKVFASLNDSAYKPEIFENTQPTQTLEGQQPRQNDAPEQSPAMTEEEEVGGRSSSAEESESNSLENIVLSVTLFSSSYRQSPPSTTVPAATTSPASATATTATPSATAASSAATFSVPVQVLHFRGTEPLSSLTDRMCCLTDRVVKGLGLERELEKEKFLLIENTFYDDLYDDDDDEDSKDDKYNKYEKDDKNEKDNGKDDFTSSPATAPTSDHRSRRPSDRYINAVLAATAPQCTFVPSPDAASQRSLRRTPWHAVPLQLGRPYLLVHQGCCEHHFVVDSLDLRAVAAASNASLPASTLLTKPRRRGCKVCERYAATKLLINDKLMPENPTAICDACFEGFHGGGGRWYQDYEVVPYYHDL